MLGGCKPTGGRICGMGRARGLWAGSNPGHGNAQSASRSIGSGKKEVLWAKIAFKNDLQASGFEPRTSKCVSGALPTALKFSMEI